MGVRARSGAGRCPPELVDELGLSALCLGLGLLLVVAHVVVANDVELAPLQRHRQFRPTWLPRLAHRTARHWLCGVACHR